MPKQVGAVGEDLPALGALVGLLPSVCPLVSVEVGVAGEAFPTNVALVGLLTRVGALMAGEVGILTEAFPTFKALMGFLSHVCSVQRQKMWVPTKDFTTFYIHAQFFCCVYSPVPDEVGVIREILATQRTQMELLGWFLWLRQSSTTCGSH